MTETIWWCEAHKLGETYEDDPDDTDAPEACSAIFLGGGPYQPCRMVQMRLVPADEVSSNPKPTTEGTR